MHTNQSTCSVLHSHLVNLRAHQNGHIDMYIVSLEIVSDWTAVFVILRELN